MNQKFKHVVVISYDAFSNTDFDQAMKYPNFKQLVERGAYTRALETVFPSLTYVIHASASTGLEPSEHGIFHNNPLQPFIKASEKKWFWFRKDINADTIYDSVKRSGGEVCSILWPTTARSSIKYNIPEIVALEGENQVLKVLRNGSPMFCIMNELKYGKFRKGTKQPQLDDYSTMCACNAIKKYKPTLTLLHLIDLDETKHKSGTYGESVNSAIERMDKRIGDVYKAIKEAGILESTAIVIFGDHSQIDIKYKVYINSVLKDFGLIEDKEWKVYTQASGGSAYVYSRIEAKELCEKALDEILEMRELGVKRVDKNYTKALIENKAYYRYSIYAKPGYSFEEDLSDKHTEELKLGDYANHGYDPLENSYKSNLIVYGKALKGNMKLDNLNVKDLASLITDLLGIELIKNR